MEVANNKSARERLQDAGGVQCWAAPEKGNLVTISITVRQVENDLMLSTLTDADCETTPHLPPTFIPLKQLSIEPPRENGPRPWSSLSVTVSDSNVRRTLIFPSDLDAKEFTAALREVKMLVDVPSRPWEVPQNKGWELPAVLVRRSTGNISQNVSKYIAQIFHQPTFITRDDWLREEGQRCESWDAYYEKDKFPETLVYMGLPFGRRGALWAKWVQQYNDGGREGEIDKETLQVIDLDLPRTHPHQLSTQTISLLREILVEIAKKRGYCQGLNYLAAVPLQIGMDQRSTLRLLNLFSTRVCPGYHDDPELRGFLRDCGVCDQLLQRLRPKHYAVLKNLEIPLPWIASEALLTQFSRSLPISVTCWIWDNILFFGPRALFAVFVSFWDDALLTAIEGIDDPSDASSIITAEFKNPQKARTALLRLPDIMPLITAVTIDQLRRNEEV